MNAENNQTWPMLGAMPTALRGHVWPDAWPRKAVTMAPEHAENNQTWPMLGAMPTALRGHVWPNAWPRKAVALAPELEQLFPRSF